MKTDLGKLHATYDLFTQRKERDCGCIERGDGQRLRRCQQHSMSLSMTGRPVKWGQSS